MWKDRAACKGMTELMFHSPTDEIGRQRAVAICSICPVRTECAEHAVVNGEFHGIWGGMDSRAIRRQRRERGIDHITPIHDTALL